LYVIPNDFVYGIITSVKCCGHAKGKNQQSSQPGQSFCIIAGKGSSLCYRGHYQDLSREQKEDGEGVVGQHNARLFRRGSEIGKFVSFTCANSQSALMTI
jgi:hypothetical protein